jgi:hypothetical protein
VGMWGGRHSETSAPANRWETEAHGARFAFVRESVASKGIEEGWKKGSGFAKIAGRRSYPEPLFVCI